MVNSILIKKAHMRLGEILGDKLKDVEHFRWGTSHIAVACLVDGTCFTGMSVCNPKDRYNRSRGHTIAVGRALKKAVDSYDSYGYMGCDFWIEPGIVKKDLRDACREKLGIPVPDKFRPLSELAAPAEYYDNKAESIWL